MFDWRIFFRFRYPDDAPSDPHPYLPTEPSSVSASSCLFRSWPQFLLFSASLAFVQSPHQHPSLSVFPHTTKFGSFVDQLRLGYQRSFASFSCFESMSFTKTAFPSCLPLLLAALSLPSRYSIPRCPCSRYLFQRVIGAVDVISPPSRVIA